MGTGEQVKSMMAREVMMYTNKTFFLRLWSVLLHTGQNMAKNRETR
jgi:hypothetical protein